MMANRRKLLIFVFAATLCASQANSKTVPITVKVNFEVSAITNTWNNSTWKRVTKDSCAAITQELRTAYRHWDFRHDGTGRAITIIFRIVDPDPHDMIIQANLQLEILKRNTLQKRWHREWLLPTDIQYRLYPSQSTMAKQLALKFREYFINNRAVPLGEWLHTSVPICKAGAWMNVNSAYLIVLSMPEKKYAYLSMSVFKIIEQPPNGLPETLEALGQGVFAPYPITNGSPFFNGITVKVVKRLSFHGEGKNLAPEIRNVKALGPVYLKEEKLFDSQDVFFSEEDVQ